MDLIRLVCVPVDEVEYQKVSGDPGDHHDDKRNELEHAVLMMEDHECAQCDHEHVVCKIQNKTDRDPIAEGAFRQRFRQIMEEAVFPECFCLVPAEQAEKCQDHTKIQVSERNEQICAVPVIGSDEKM